MKLRCAWISEFQISEFQVVLVLVKIVNYQLSVVLVIAPFPVSPEGGKAFWFIELLSY